MPSSDLRDAVLLLAPGFIAFWIYNAFGYRRRRSDWHWAVWSVIASLPLDYSARWVLTNGPRVVTIAPDLADGLSRLTLAVVAGLTAAWAWRALRWAPWWWAKAIVGALTDSVWDPTLEEAAYYHRSIEIETVDNARYFGWFNAPREDSGAEPWIRLRRFTRNAPDGSLDDEPGRVEVLLHRSQIRRVTIYEGTAETEARHALEAAIEGPPDAGL